MLSASQNAFDGPVQIDIITALLFRNLTERIRRLLGCVEKKRTSSWGKARRKYGALIGGDDPD
jgi:hypothetical protein